MATALMDHGCRLFRNVVVIFVALATILVGGYRVARSFALDRGGASTNPPRGNADAPEMPAALRECAGCHPGETAGYASTAMARSFGTPLREPPATFTHSVSGTTFSIEYSGSQMIQRLQRRDVTAEYKIAYSLGSGSHAISYLIELDHHLFQSPICYYPRRGQWDMAPGYEHAEFPDFFRPIVPRCLFCHVGRARPVRNTLNTYRNPPVSQEVITCERCHGPSQAHLAHPSAGNIVNPARLPVRARDSVCEQCHLAGEDIVLNPRKHLSDFHPGMDLEDVYTVYVFASSRNPSHPGPLTVVSQSQQLALSLCAQQSNGKLWCGTCHDPHRPPADPVAYYRSRCLSCHGASLLKTHPKPNANCISCHMPRLPVVQGAHTIFTDHRIAIYSARQLATTAPVSPTSQGKDKSQSLVAWDNPPAKFAERNLGLADILVGERIKSVDLVYRGDRLLLECEPEFPNDPVVWTAIGQVLLGAHRPRKAVLAFNRAIQLQPDDASNYLHAALAYEAMSEYQNAILLLKKALQLDPVLQQPYHELEAIFSRDHDTEMLRQIRAQYAQAFPGRR
jgi:hypothetical protein